MSAYLEINFDIEKYSKDKEVIANTIGRNTINKLQSMFKWTGLPKTIPQKWLEVMLMVNGFAFITEHEGNLYAFNGGLGGEPDPYYQPTKCIVANPALKLSKEYEIGVDGVLMSNDALRQGVVPLIGKYAGLLAENTITIRIADIMARITNIMSAGDDDTISSAQEYIRQIEEGKLGVIEESPFLEDLKVQTGATQSSNTRLTDLIEMEQYLKASMYNELGLEANYNMKREAINSSEAQLGDDVLQPYIDHMLQQRQEACKAINEMFGTDIWVEFNSAWQENEDTRDAELEQVELEAEQMEAEVEQSEAETEQAEVETEIMEDNNNDDTTESDDQGTVSDDGDTDEPEEQEDSSVADSDESE